MADVTTQIGNTGNGGWNPSATPSPTPTPAPTTTPATGTTQDASSAKALIAGTLGNYGLGSLADWAWGKWQNGESIDQIMLELRATPEYKTRFPAMDTLAKAGRAISESQYINYEQSASSIFKAAGLPANFYDGPEDFTSFLTNNIALPELQTRVQAYQVAAYSAPQAVRDEMTRLWGVTPGELTAFFIDPDKALPLIQQRYAASQAAGWSDQTGFGQLSKDQALQVGNMGLSDSQLATQFGTLAQMQPLFTGLQGTSESNISTQQAIDAGFDQNAQDQALIAARKAERLNTFQAGGQVATTQGGAVGAGSAH